MKIKCSCGKSDCEGAIWFEKSYDSISLWFTNSVIKHISEKGGIVSEVSINLDANGLVELINQARAELISLTQKYD